MAHLQASITQLFGVPCHMPLNGEALKLPASQAFAVRVAREAIEAISAAAAAGAAKSSDVGTKRAREVEEAVAPVLGLTPEGEVAPSAPAERAVVGVLLLGERAQPEDEDQQDGALDCDVVHAPAPPARSYPRLESVRGVAASLGVPEHRLRVRLVRPGGRVVQCELDEAVRGSLRV